MEEILPKFEVGEIILIEETPENFKAQIESRDFDLLNNAWRYWFSTENGRFSIYENQGVHKDIKPLPIKHGPFINNVLVDDIEKPYSRKDVIRISEAYDNYMSDSFCDDDTYIIELIQKKKWEKLDAAFKRGI